MVIANILMGLTDSFLSYCIFLSQNRIIKNNRERKLKEKQEKKIVSAKPLIGSATALVAGAAKPAITSYVADRRHLHNYRVVQRNLVYVIGLPGRYSRGRVGKEREV